MPGITPGIFSTTIGSYTILISDLGIYENYPSGVHSYCTYVTSHIYDGVTASSVAEYFGLTENHLGPVFCKETGKNLTRYIQEQKIRESCYLLERTNMPLAEIARILRFRLHFS